MTTSRQQAAINIAKQIDSLRLWAAGHDPEVAQIINSAIAAELANQATGIAPSQRLSGAGFGQGFDDITGSLEADPISFASSDPIQLDTSTPLASVSNNIPTGDVSGFDLSSIGNMFASAGSGATPSLSSTSIASNAQSVSGVLNSITNTVNTAIRDIYSPQVTLAQAQAQLGIIQAQAQAAQLGLSSQAAQQKSLDNLLMIGGLGVLAIFGFKAIAGMNDKRASVTTTQRKNF